MASLVTAGLTLAIHATFLSVLGDNLRGLPVLGMFMFVPCPSTVWQPPVLWSEEYWTILRASCTPGPCCTVVWWCPWGPWTAPSVVTWLLTWREQYSTVQAVYLCCTVQCIIQHLVTSHSPHACCSGPVPCRHWWGYSDLLPAQKNWGPGGSAPGGGVKGGGMKPPFSKKRGNLTAKKCLKNAIFRMSTGGTLTFYRHCRSYQENKSVSDDQAVISIFDDKTYKEIWFTSRFNCTPEEEISISLD